MTALLRALRALRDGTPGGVAGWLSRIAYWRERGPR